MEVFRIQRGTPVIGEVSVSGAKNAALPIFAATLLTADSCTIENVPDLSDIRFMADILRSIGATVTNPARCLASQAKDIEPVAPYELVRKMRASICLMADGQALPEGGSRVSGGCVIGSRPIDLHLKGLRKLGCKIDHTGGNIHVEASNLAGGKLFLGGRHVSTVTGTANLVMAAVLAKGITIIDSAACEPEITDLCRMLQAMGAKIEGVGSHELKIEGVESLHGCTHSVLPDRIEAGTYILGTAMAGGEVTVRGARGRHLNSLLDKLENIGVETSLDPKEQDTIRVARDPSVALKPTDIITMAYPGFPTDLQAQMSALMTVTPGLSIITERVYPNRFMHVSELQRMGVADIAIEGASAIIKGVGRLSGAPNGFGSSGIRCLDHGRDCGKKGNLGQRIYHLDRRAMKIST